MGFSKNGNSDNLALVNYLTLAFIVFHKMGVALISLYYSLANLLLYHWQTKIFKNKIEKLFIIYLCK